MCHKGIIGFIGMARDPEFFEKEKRTTAGCCFGEVLSDFSTVEEITKYGHMRLRDVPSFKKLFKNLWKDF